MSFRSTHHQIKHNHYNPFDEVVSSLLLKEVFPILHESVAIYSFIRLASIYWSYCVTSTVQA